jgi:site-specific recombinase XerD
MICETLGVHVRRFANSKRKEATIAWYRNTLSSLIEFFGADCPVHSIGRIEADTYWEYIRNRRDYWASHPMQPTLKQRLSDTTLHNFLRAVRTFWNALVKQRVVEYNVFDHLSYTPDKQMVEGRHNLHAFRHRFAQAWLDKGMNAQILSKALGHADVTVTLLIYGNQDDRRVATAMRQLEMSPFEDPQGLEEL